MKQFVKSSLKKSRLLFCLISTTLLLFTSCEKEDIKLEKKKNPAPVNENGISLEIIQKLESAGFNTSEGLRKFEKGYLVEYDILLTEEQINDLVLSKTDLSNARVKHYRTNERVEGLPRTLLIFMDPSFDSYMQTSFNNAINRYNDVNLSLRLQRTSVASSANIQINAFYETPVNGRGTLGISAGFPSGGNPASPIRLNTWYYNSSTKRVDATTVIAHEIGHAIGFRHTDYMDRRFSCGDEGLNPNEGSGDVGAIHIPGTPTSPSPNSWMLACSNGSDRPFTSEDQTALRGVYPPSTFINWEGTEGMTSMNGLIYIVQNSRLHKVNADGTYTLLGTGNWAGTEGMTSMGGYLYISQVGKLHKVNPTNGSYTYLGTGNWAGTEGMTSMNGLIYIVQNSKLYKVDANGTYTLLGSSNWAGTEGMTTLDGYLYISQVGKLHKVNPTNGSYTYLGTGNWAGTEGMTSMGGYLYISQVGKLHKVNPTNGSYTYLGTGNWAGTEGMTSMNGLIYIVQNKRLHKVNPTDGSYILL